MQSFWRVLSALHVLPEHMLVILRFVVHVPLSVSQNPCHEKGHADCLHAFAVSLPVSCLIHIILLIVFCAGVMRALPAHWGADLGDRLGGRWIKDAGWIFYNRVSLPC